jgi:hypothetical protein
MRNRDDVVDPADRKLHGILVHIAETSSDENLRKCALDLILTLPPIKDWSAEQFRGAAEVFARIAPRQHTG